MTRKLTIAVFFVLGILILAEWCRGADYVSSSFTWDQNKETNLAGYRVKWGFTNSGTGWVKTVTTNFATIDFSNSVPHWLHVTAFNTAGFESLPSSNLMVDIPGSPARGRMVSGTVISTTISNWISVP
jgi:hypothetical protein